jgi:two-component system phosphate regulon sensor histidine kinase PhoR
MRRPWKDRLLVKFFLSYLLVVFVLFVFFDLYSGKIIKAFYISTLSAKMRQEAKIVSRLLPSEVQGETLDRISRELARELGARLTVIALDGKVLGDSDEPSATMENHGTRPEVMEARSQGSGRSIRYSTTMRYDMLYHTISQQEKNQGRIVRVSIPLKSVDEAVGSVQRAILFGLLLVSGTGLVLAFFFFRGFGRRVKRMAEFSQQVAQGSLPRESFLARGNDELSVLEKNMNEMSWSIQEKIKAMVAEKEKVESILRCMTEGVLVVDLQGRVILLNENAKKMFNLPEAQRVSGVSFTEVSRHPEMKKLMEEVLACDCSSKCFSKEVCLEGSGWFRINAVGLRDGDEMAVGYILVFHDVTELRRLETVRADFVANVSHELRTPLTAIQGYAETLLHRPPAEPQDFLSIIHRHSERLGRLIDDLLTLSDLESGKAQLTKENLHAGNLIGRVLEIFREQAGKKSVTLSHAVEPGLPAIFGDSDRLQQLLINLIDNALKYTPSGGQVKVTAGPAAAMGDHEPMVEIDVADTGCGIPQKDLPRLTERFYRVDKARSRQLGGTGLGLAIVKHIVQAHHGSLKIESQIVKGTTVRVFLRSSGTNRQD